MKNLPFQEKTIAFNCKDQTRPSWMQRAELCADMLLAHVPLGSAELTLADIGCGDQKLKEVLLNRELQFIYTGYDLIPQSPDVRLLDIAYEPLPCAFDVAVMLGVIEYLETLPDVLNQLSKQVKFFVLSHVIRQDDAYTPSRRAELGWVNHLSKDELTKMLSLSGFSVVNQRIDAEGKTLLTVCCSNKYK